MATLQYCKDVEIPEKTSGIWMEDGTYYQNATGKSDYDNDEYSTNLPLPAQFKAHYKNVVAKMRAEGSVKLDPSHTSPWRLIMTDQQHGVVLVYDTRWHEFALEWVRIIGFVSENYTVKLDNFCGLTLTPKQPLEKVLDLLLEIDDSEMSYSEYVKLKRAIKFIGGILNHGNV